MDERPTSLDPADWSDLRAQGHRMLDDMFDYLEKLRERPVWQHAPADVRVEAGYEYSDIRCAGHGGAFRMQAGS